MRLDCQIPSRHRPAMLHALQLARQVPCSLSVEGTSVSISRAVALRRYPAFPRACRALRQSGQSGPVWLTSLGALPSFSDEPSREQAFEIDRKKQRQHLYRHRRLDLRAVARGVLSRKAHAGEGAVLRRVETDLDRDQRHLLRLAEAGEFSQMGARGARRIRVLVEGTALRDQPSCAGGSRRFRKTLLRFRRAGARRPARPGAVAVRADQKIRRGRFRQVPRTAAAQTRGTRAASRGRGAARQFLRAGVHRVAAQVRNAGRVRRARQISGDRRRRQRLRLCAAAEGQ